MKKIATLALAAVMVAGSAAFLPQIQPASAEAPEEIKAVARYDFNDENDLGKDSSGNGLHLAKFDNSASTDAEKGVDIGTEGEGANAVSFAKLRRTNDVEGSLRGGILYAPFFSGTTQDFSDMITGSYTVTIKFRGADLPQKGDRYLLHTGKYNSSVAITPWRDQIEIMPVSEGAAPAGTENAYDWTQTQKVFIPAQSNEGWHTVTIVGNQGDNTVTVYHNGERTNEIPLTDGAKPLFSAGSAGGSGPYTFCLGGQCEGRGGNAAVMFCSADIDYVRIYDVPLSESNVTKLYNGEEAVVDNDEYIASIGDLDYSGVDLKVTDTNTLKDIKSALPKTVKVTTSSGASRNVPLYWYETETEIRGYLQSSLANVKSLMPKTNYSYTVRFTYDEDLLDISDVKINDNAIVPGSDMDKNIRGLLTFKIAPKNGASVTGFYFDDMEWLIPDDLDLLYDEDSGVYFFDIGGPCNIEIYASVRQGTVSYYDGTEKLGTSKYSVGGNEELKTFEKEGYRFEGWFTDAECKNAFAGLDYSDPADITLYAKYTAVGGGNGENGGKRGCGGNLTISAVVFAGALVLTAGAVLAVKKKNSGK